MPAPQGESIAEALSPLTAEPARAGIFLDIDGTLAPIVDRPDESQVSQGTSRLLGILGRRYGCVACVSGRAATEARRLVGVGSIAYAGTHGAELLEPGAAHPTIPPDFAKWRETVHGFAEDRFRELRPLRVRLEDKGPVMAFHWRGVPDENDACGRLEEVAQEAQEEGLETHWGRKVLEIRPPVPMGKGQAVRELAGTRDLSSALFAGDDVTDLDGFEALDALREEGRLDATVRVGVRSDEGPAEIVERADLVVEGIDGFAHVLAVLAEE